ncbi:hypothetical protein V6N13_137566 [Hibiscus sabdariffa]|uniref:Benzyl alcohol O-benzoyltransferase n=1 Tax=Hibiscus sabdariffa TaxID=183260 RepID=A0ABR2DK93_9ROSI
MIDAIGVSQFMHVMAEIARDALTPLIPPVWERHLLSARDPPFITCVHHAYNDAPSVEAIDTIFSTNNLVRRSFFFRPTHISAFRRFTPDNSRCSTFDILTAYLWRCRMKATEEHMRSMIDMLVIKDRPVLCCRLWLVSDLRRAKIEEVDFGWGKAARMVPAEAFEFMNFYIPYEDGILVPVSLAVPVMEIFVKEMHGLLNFRDEATGVC